MPSQPFLQSVDVFMRISHTRSVFHYKIFLLHAKKLTHRYLKQSMVFSRGQGQASSLIDPECRACNPAVSSRNHVISPRTPVDHRKLFVSEMLFPFEDVAGDLQALDRLDFERLHDLSSRYDASIDATCYKVAEVANNTASSFVLLTDLRGRFSGGDPLWVRHSSPSKVFKVYVPPGTLPPSSSVALQSFREGKSITESAKETWWIHGSPRTHLVQAAMLPPVDNPDYPQVVALLLPQGYKGGGGYCPNEIL